MCIRDRLLLERLPNMSLNESHEVVLVASLLSEDMRPRRLAQRRDVDEVERAATLTPPSRR
eukprot:1058959-Pyramimonas_sp.AAC.1